MEKIQPGKYVEMTYKLYQIDPDGGETLVYEGNPADPEKIVFGVTQGVIEPLEKALDGLEKGGKFNVTVKPEEAFGNYDPEQVAELDKQIFYVDGKFDDEMVKPGAIVPMMTADGHRLSGLVKAVSDDKVTLDFNHPLAGKSVRFDGEILEVREATPEDIAPMGGGCGCGDHECGCGDDCGCGDHEGHDDCGCGCSSCH